MLRFGSLSVLWISGFILLGIPLAEGFLGYILDWGQMSYRGVTAMINILVTLFPVYMSSCLPESIWRSCNVIISRIFVSSQSALFLDALRSSSLQLDQYLLAQGSIASRYARCSFCQNKMHSFYFSLLLTLCGVKSVCFNLRIIGSHRLVNSKHRIFTMSIIGFQKA